MNTRKWLHGLPSVLAVLLLASAPLQAGAETRLVGTDVDIFYDESAWGAATISGNTIAFQTALEFGATPGTFYDTVFGGTLIVVAHDGVALTGAVTLGMGGNYAFPGALNWPYRDGAAAITSTVMLYDPAAADSETGGYLGWASAGVSQVQPPLESTGSFAFVTVANTALGSYASLGVGTLQILYAAPKTASVSITSASFGFDVAVLGAVPEADTWTLMAAGLLLVAGAARRRRG